MLELRRLTSGNCINCIKQSIKSNYNAGIEATNQWQLYNLQCRNISYYYGQTDTLIGRSVDWLIDWLIWFDSVWFDSDWFDWLFDWLIDWLIDWLTDWLIVWCSFFDLVMDMIADRSSAVLDVESDVKLCSIKVCTGIFSSITFWQLSRLSHCAAAGRLVEITWSSLDYLVEDSCRQLRVTQAIVDGNSLWYKPEMMMIMPVSYIQRTRLLQLCFSEKGAVAACHRCCKRSATVIACWSRWSLEFVYNTCVWGTFCCFTSCCCWHVATGQTTDGRQTDRCRQPTYSWADNKLERLHHRWQGSIVDLS